MKRDTILLAVAGIAIGLAVAFGFNTYHAGQTATPAETAPEPELSPLDALAKRAAEFGPRQAAQDRVTEDSLVHLAMGLIGLVTILLLTSEHKWLSWIFPGAARVRARGDRLRERTAAGDMPTWEERASQHRNETMVTCARIIAAGIVLGLTLSG